MTGRKAVCYWSFCVSCIALALSMIGYDRWADWSIRNALAPGQPAVAGLPYFDLKRVSVTIGNCSPDHFWGSAIAYWDEKEPSPEGYMYSGRVCRDWSNAKWILVQHVEGSWSRYWLR